MRNNYLSVVNQKSKIAVVGLGYVGMPLAVGFAEKVQVVGFDVNREKVEKYRNGIDVTSEVGDACLKKTTAEFTSDPEKIRDASFVIIAVPTPINQDKTPDLEPVESASRIVGKNLSKGAIVVYESTVYPGVTETICAPILEQESGLKCGEDFGIGYSPERINPGDRIHRLSNIKKIVSGCSREVLREIASLYQLVVEAGVYEAPNIKVAEAAKLIENTQRDVNIGFMNELAMVFEQMGISTYDVLEAMNTKWNALGFQPGLVGGHCIGVDPYYFMYQAEQYNYHPRLITMSRQINDNMGRFIAEAAVRQLIRGNKKVKGSRVGVFGITFKENCPDVRNTRVVDIISSLQELGVEVLTTDCQADPEETRRLCHVNLVPEEEITDVDMVIVAVSHRQYCSMRAEDFQAIMRFRSEEQNAVLDVKAVLSKSEIRKAGMLYWSF